MAVGSISYTPRKALHQTDIVDNLVSTASDLPLSALQGKILRENTAESLSWKQDRTEHTITLAGDRELFYPVTFPYVTKYVNKIEINREIHEDSHGLGGMRFMALFGSFAWGAYPPFIKAVINLYRGRRFIARCQYGTGNVYNAVIWLRGGCTYHIYTDTKSKELEIYYEKVNLGREEAYPFWVEPLTEVDAELNGNSLFGVPYSEQEK